MKFAICNETYQPLPFEEVCADVAACGYDGLEIAPFTLAANPAELTETEARRIGGIAHRAGLEVVGLHWLLLQPPGMSITSPDSAARERTIAFARHLARICAAMDGRVMVWGSPKQRWIAAGQSREEAFRYAVASVRAVCEVASPLGVTVAMEPLSYLEANFLTTAAETLDFITAVDHPACRLHLDVKAMSYEMDPYAAIIHRAKEYLVHFHANDPNMRGPGFGEVDFTSIVQALHDIGYGGYVSVEVFDYRPDAHTIATESLRYLRRVAGEVGG